MARQVHESVTRSLGVAPADAPVDLSELSFGFVDSMASVLESYPVDAAKKATAAFEEWASTEERDMDALSTLLDDAFDGAEGALQNSLRLLYGETFADMNRAVQVELGVEGYYWLTMRDDRVREEHADLDNADSDGEPYSWDDPPLKASKSSNKEDDHPGDDYNCRCIAVPALPKGE